MNSMHLHWIVDGTTYSVTGNMTAIQFLYEALTVGGIDEAHVWCRSDAWPASLLLPIAQALRVAHGVPTGEPAYRDEAGTTLHHLVGGPAHLPSTRGLWYRITKDQQPAVFLVIMPRTHATGDQALAERITRYGDETVRTRADLEPYVALLRAAAATAARSGETTLPWRQMQELQTYLVAPDEMGGSGTGSWVPEQLDNHARCDASQRTPAADTAVTVPGSAYWEGLESDIVDEGPYRLRLIAAGATVEEIIAELDRVISDLRFNCADGLTGSSVVWDLTPSRSDVDCDATCLGGDADVPRRVEQRAGSAAPIDPATADAATFLQLGHEDGTPFFADQTLHALAAEAAIAQLVNLAVLATPAASMIDTFLDDIAQVNAVLAAYAERLRALR